VIQFNVQNGESRSFVHKRLIRAAGGFIGGGFTGAARGFIKTPKRAGVIPGTNRLTSARIALNAKRARQQRAIVRAPGLRAGIERLVPGGRTGLMVAAASPGDGCPQGFHPNKSDYMTKAGFVAEGTKCVRNRRRNLSNGRANTRSLRRMAAWDKQERRLGKTLKAIARGR